VLTLQVSNQALEVDCNSHNRTHMHGALQALLGGMGKCYANNRRAAQYKYRKYS